MISSCILVTPHEDVDLFGFSCSSFRIVISSIISLLLLYYYHRHAAGTDYIDTY
jgi:hypothetical protein